MKHSSIEWTDHTFNPWEGCTKVSPGCANCYAEARNRRFAGGANWGPGAPRRRTSEANWRQPLRWNDQPLQLDEKNGHRHARVFCASLADWLDEEVPIEWFCDLLALINETDNLDWLLLTKRPENFEKRIAAVLALGIREAGPAWYVAQCWSCEVPPPNVWLGTTVEDQARADERIPHLLRIPARVRFLSCEPLLGPVDLDRWVFNRAAVVERVAAKMLLNEHQADAITDHVRVHWVICGGESGPGARPMHPAWARSLRDQCAASGVAFFFKQWGEWLPDDQRGFTLGSSTTWCLVNKSGQFRVVLSKGARDWQQDSAWSPGEQGVTKVGKMRAGRSLDGFTYEQFPNVRHA